MNIPSFKCKTLGLLALATLAVPFSACAVGQQQPSSSAFSATVSVAALRVLPKARAHFEKARLAVITGHQADYEREITAALTLDPNFGEAYVLRASRSVLAEHFQSAISDVLTAQRLEPHIRWATIVHAEACNGMRQWDQAFALLDTLSSVELGTWQAKYEMTRALVGRGDAVAALQWSKLALQAVPDAAMPDTILLRAGAFQAARRWQEALEQLDHYLALPGPLPLRTRVLTVRNRVEQHAREETLTTVASQERPNP